MAAKRSVFVLVLDLLITAGYLALAQVNRISFAEQINFLPFALFPVVGAVLLFYHPRNPVSHLITVLGFSVMAAGLSFEYARLAANRGPAGLPLSELASVSSFLLWTLVLPILVLILLLFPNGRLISSRWKLLAVFPILITLPVLTLSMIVGWRNRHALILMELGRVPRSAEVETLFQVYDLWNIALIAVIVLAFINFILRFRRARGIERQQLKWFVLGLGTIPVSMLLDELIGLFNYPMVQVVNWTLNFVSITALPVVMLIAITRYRLYDIDFIIRRTLLYSALTLTLAITYFSVVLVMQTLFTWSFGEQPAVVLTLTTLLIAWMFQPLRHRFQSVIDRRFYRSKYDAEQIIETFQSQLQNEVDLNKISQRFLGVVEETMQPEQASFWMLKK